MLAKALLGLVVCVALSACESEISFTRTRTPDGPATIVNCGRDDLSVCVDAAKERCHGGFVTLKRTERGTWTERTDSDGETVRKKVRANTITFVCQHETSSD